MPNLGRVYSGTRMDTIWAFRQGYVFRHRVGPLRAHMWGTGQLREGVADQGRAGRLLREGTERAVVGSRRIPRGSPVGGSR